MTTVNDIAAKIRSKNAGPFWLTIDIFCDSAGAFTRLRDGLSSDAVAAVLGTSAQTLARFDLTDLNVIKFSAPRPAIQGTRGDRDMHGASFANLIAELRV